MSLQCGENNHQIVVAVGRWDIRQTGHSHQRHLAGFKTEKDSRTVIYQSTTKMADVSFTTGYGWTESLVVLTLDTEPQQEQQR